MGDEEEGKKKKKAKPGKKGALTVYGMPLQVCVFVKSFSRRGKRRGKRRGIERKIKKKNITTTHLILNWKN